MHRHQIRNTLLLVAGALIWGVAFVAQAVGSGYVGAYTFLACRSWLACAFLLGLLLVRRRLAVTTLVMMRWNGYAAIHALCGGLLFVALAEGEGRQYLVYGLGNLACLGALVMFPIFGKERIRNDSFLSVSFGVAVQLLMLLGRTAAAAALGFPGEALVGFITTDTLSVLFTAVLMWIIRRIEGLFEDQKHYLLRVQAEQQTERGVKH